MSFARARSGGRSIWMTFTRKNRSSRKRLGLDGELEVPVGRGDQPDVERRLRAAAHGADAPLLKRAQQLGLQRQWHVSDLVEEQRSPMGLHEQPGMGRPGVGEGPLHVAEQLALQQRLRQRRAVDGDHRGVLAAAGVVERACDSLLAGAALPGDQDRGVRIGHSLDELPDRLHRRALARDLADHAGGVHLLSQASDLVAQGAVLHGTVERQGEGRHVERLGDEVVGPGPDGLDGRLHAAEGGDHHHRRVRSVGGDLRAQVDAVAATQVDVGDHDVELLGLEQPEGLVGRGPRAARVALGRQLGHQRVTHLSIVVDDQNSPGHTTCLPFRHARCLDSGSRRAESQDACRGKYTVNPGPRLAARLRTSQPPCSLMMPRGTLSPENASQASGDSEPGGPCAENCA